MKTCFWVFIVLSVLILQGCARFSVESRVENADSMAEQVGWKKQTIDTEYFAIRSYSPRFEKSRLSDRLAVYIEGDGLAWISRTKPSSNPTPMNPLALTLAMKDRGSAVYLGRPCQYVEDKKCSRKYWTAERFAPEVVASMDEAVSLVKAKMHASQLVLVGYSGGGAVAALVAAKRDDVVRLVTVAGNLDPQKWTQQLNVSPLTGSLNPADYWEKLTDIPQLHLVGENDSSVPLFVAESYQGRFPAEKKPEVKVVEGFDHHCCWSTQWPELME
ncbi:alpha/beta hydrolase [Marinomonas foliarum]|uniref:Alpha/beta hydrolase n=1 Tax=Marinomonas foliarum TaxID=491950 RepID=A0ABX7IJU1_9GAMM|nr:alpha/beta hydrolase [Marinomonas foliarum]QRV22603.1 alpha/beta hydrolase [Marinomonas foliarum]